MAMKPIKLYQISISHFCEKIRFCFDYKKIPYQVVELDVIKRTTLKEVPKSVRKLVPIIHDPNHDVFMSDSTPIMEYLDQKYPEPALFPGNEEEKKKIKDWCIRLDSILGTASRRLAYSQLLSESPSMLFDLLIKPTNPQLNKPIIRGLVTNVVAVSLMERYAIHLVREEKIYEQTDSLLEELVSILNKQKYVVGDGFTAADITLVSLLTPLSLVPYVSENPRYKVLFDYHQKISQDFNRVKNQSILQDIIEKRTKKSNNPLSILLMPVTMFFSILSFILYNVVESFPKRNKPKGPVMNSLYSKVSENLADNDHRVSTTMTSPWSLINGALLMSLYNLYIK